MKISVTPAPRYASLIKDESGWIIRPEVGDEIRATSVRQSHAKNEAIRMGFTIR